MANINKISIRGQSGDTSYDIEDVVARNKVKGSTITLPYTAWGSDNRQTVSYPGVTDNNYVIIAPLKEKYASYGIKGESQSTDSIVFICEEKPNEDIPLDVIVLTV